MSKEKHQEGLDFLLANICHLHHLRAHQLFESIGLYRGQPPVLRTLWEQEGLTQRELADQVKITPATMTKMLQRMEKSGFIQRKADQSDQRITRVYLTEMGKAVKADVEGLWQTMEADTFANISPEDQHVLREYLTQIRENLIRATGEQPCD